MEEDNDVAGGNNRTGGEFSAAFSLLGVPGIPIIGEMRKNIW